MNTFKFFWLNFLWHVLKDIFVLLNGCSRRMTIYQNPHWKNNFSQLMTQLFMFDQTRASKPRVCAIIIRGAISHQGENFPIVSCWIFFCFSWILSRGFLIVFFPNIFLFILDIDKDFSLCCSFSFCCCGTLFILERPNTPRFF